MRASVNRLAPEVLLTITGALSIVAARAQQDVIYDESTK